jgi:putative FmdB family regulatory protein
MPLYEYECDACGHRFEVIQRFSDAPIEKCPVCEGPVHKLQSAPAFQFKGTGWYVTDYAKSAGSPDAKAGKDEKGSKEGTDAGKADTASSGKTASTSTGASSSTPSTTPAKSETQK